MRMRGISHSHFSFAAFAVHFPFTTSFYTCPAAYCVPLFFVTRMQDDRGRIERRLFMRKRGVVQYTKAMSELHRYSSIKEAETVYSISHISGVCRRRRKSDGGYVWRYEDDVDPLSEQFVPARS